MRVTVLGKSPAWQDAAGACSGYLVQEQGYTLLLDPLPWTELFRLHGELSRIENTLKLHKRRLQ